MRFKRGAWPLRLWVGVATIWIFWPIILTLHAGRSRRRAYISLAVSAALLALPMQAYYSTLAPQVFTLEEMISFSPYDVGAFTVGYVRGWAAAKQRSGRAPIVLEGYGMGGALTPGTPPFSKEVAEKYQLNVEAIALCVVNPYILGHARGYNTAAVGEIKRRHGAGVIEAAEQEESARQQRFTDMKNAGHADAENDAREGRLAYLIYQPRRGGEEEYRELLREHYQIALRRVSESYAELDEPRQAYVSGYNEAASDEIARRFGEQARQNLWAFDYRAVEEFRRALAAAGQKTTITHGDR